MSNINVLHPKSEWGLVTSYRPNIHTSQNELGFERFIEYVLSKGYYYIPLEGYWLDDNQKLQKEQSLIVFKDFRDPDKLRMDCLDMLCWKIPVQKYGFIKYHDRDYVKKLTSGGKEEYQGVVRVGPSPDSGFSYQSNGFAFHIS